MALFRKVPFACFSYINCRTKAYSTSFHKLSTIANLTEYHKTSYFKYFVILSTGFFFGKKFYKNLVHFPSVSAASNNIQLSNARKQFNFISDVVEKSAPAVVYIEIKDTRIVDFFTGKPRTISNGSGFIVKENGLILTNAHVVANAPNSKVEVRLQNGISYIGYVEDIDVRSDLATVRIPANNLPTLKLGDSSSLRPGEFVVAIGSPLALSNTITFGVISAISRGSDELGLRGKDMVYLQTDAAITFGNSGGPLVNLDGEAVGINSMKVTAGISFAIPSDYVKEFLKSTEGGPQSRRPGQLKRYIGITMVTITPQILHELQQRQQPLPAGIRGGVLVWKVILGSPAYNGGLQPGDIVTHINGQPISNANEVYAILGEAKEKTIRMMVNRSGRNIDLFITPENIS